LISTGEITKDAMMIGTSSNTGRTIPQPLLIPTCTKCYPALLWKSMGITSLMILSVESYSRILVKSFIQKAVQELKEEVYDLPQPSEGSA
jgi:predicted RNA-binding protein (virulence factor B family)